MGWASAGEIFNRTARAVLESQASDAETIEILYELADALRDGDWDTVDESIEEFAEYPYVVLALRMASGLLELDSATGDFATLKYERNTRQWVLTPNGHDPVRAKMPNMHLEQAGERAREVFNGLVIDWARLHDRPEDYETAQSLMV